MKQKNLISCKQEVRYDLMPDSGCDLEQNHLLTNFLKNKFPKCKYFD